MRRDMRQFRVWMLAAILNCGISLGIMAQTSDGHFFLSFEGKNVPVENVEQHFAEWFSLPADTEWQLVGSSTDLLGMDRIEYRQFVGGIEVEHSQILLHVKDGKVNTANGTVMEQQSTPQPSAKIRRSSKVLKSGSQPDLLGRTLYLVATDDGYRYAYKTLAADGKAWIYTDADSGEELKRVGTRHYIDKPEGTAATATGKSIYSGDVQLDVTKSSDGKTWLYDQKRNIHTLLASYIPSNDELGQKGTIYKYLPQGNMPDNYMQATEEDKFNWDIYLSEQRKQKKIDDTQLISDFCSYFGNEGNTYSAYKLNKLTINKLATENNYGAIVPVTLPVSYRLLIRYGKDRTDLVSHGVIEDTKMTIDGLPVTFDFSAYQEVIPREGITIDIMGYEEDLFETKFYPYLSLTLDPSVSENGIVYFESDLVDATVEYEPSSDPVADIHWGMGKTLDFYNEVFKRNSYDGKGAPVYNLAYLYNDQDKCIQATENCNAMANTDTPPYPMVYGMGGYNQTTETSYNFWKPVVELSVMSHEFTHLVTMSTANLEYRGESGAIDEAFSDMMGITMKKYLKNNSDWMIGGDGMIVGLQCMRDMAQPKGSSSTLSCLPDTYHGMYWGDITDDSSANDYGGVHTNMGVGCKWYYLLTEGGQGTNDDTYSYNVKGVGIEKARQIAYRTQTVYASIQTKYADYRKIAIQAAKDLYGEGAETKAVAAAWKK